MKSWKLAETNYGQIKQATYEIAVLPLGATEPHNLHLPYGTDTLEGTIVGEHICEAAQLKGAKVILLPTVPYGTETNMREMPLAMNINPSTLNAVVTDLIESLEQSGIKKILLLNSHGGNELKPLLRELHGKISAHLFLCNWYRTISDVYDDIFSAPEDHAGEMETSFLLAYAPHLVAKNDDGSLTADDGKSSRMQFAALNEGWVSITRPWHLLTTNSGSGNPHAASAEKGRRLMEVIVERLATFLAELSRAELNERFPFS